MRKKFLFTTLPTNDLGLLTRSLPIARELSNRGHMVIFSHPARSPQKVIGGGGFENIIPLHPLYEIGFSKLNFNKLKTLFFSPIIRKKYGTFIGFIWELIKSIPYKTAPRTDQIWDMDHAFAISGFLNEYFVKSQCESYLDVIVESKVDAVIDFWNPFVGIACRKLGIPLITVNQADALPNSKGFIWWKDKPEDIPSVTHIINNVLKDYGVPPINKTEELNVGDLTLIVGIPETDPIEGAHNCHYIGPLLWQNSKNELPESLNNLPKDKPIIWIYSGNPKYGRDLKYANSDILLYGCVKALNSNKYTVVLSTGYFKLPKDIGQLPDNFIHTGFIPGLKMAQKCDLMIHHGGYGSCQTGLYTGTPSLVLPTFSERESNARRIANIGAGDYVIPLKNDKNERYFDVNEIREKTEKILESPQYVTNLTSLSQKLKSFGGPSKAADLIEDFIYKN